MISKGAVQRLALNCVSSRFEPFTSSLDGVAKVARHVLYLMVSTI